MYEEVRNNDGKVYYNTVPPPNQQAQPLSGRRTNNAAYENIDENQGLTGRRTNNATYENIDENQGSTGRGADAAYEDVYDIAQQRNRRCIAFGNFYYPATGRQTRGPWKPVAVRGISIYPPEATPELKAEDFVKNPQHIIEEYSTSQSHERRQLLRQFFLHSALPYMETRLEENTHSSPEVLKILPSLACCSNDSQVNRYSLHLILDVLSKGRYDENIKSFILECEKGIRRSITGENFQANVVSDSDDQGFRVFVYSRVLIMLAAQIKQRQISIDAWTECKDLVEKLYKKLYSLKDETPFTEKQRPRYAIACIKQAKDSLNVTERLSHSMKFLTYCLQEHYQNDLDDLEEKEKRDKNIEKFVKTICSDENGWFDLHVVVSFLTPQIHENPKTISILRVLVEHYSFKRESDLKKPLRNKVKRGRGRWTKEALWQTGMFLGDVLENIVMNNKRDATRSEACATLEFYVKRLNCKEGKNSTEKLFVCQSFERCRFGGPLKEVEEPLAPKSCMTFLQSTRYRKELPPSRFQFIGKDEKKALYKVPFRGEESAVKILLDSSDVARRGDDKERNKQYENLLKEAYFLRRLNSCSHPNILKVFAYDTSAEPYHLITEYHLSTTLLQFLQSTRSDIQNTPNPSVLIQMVIGVVDGLIYINQQHLVHLAVTSQDVLVGKNKICRITGFQALREMTYNEETHVYEYLSQLDETSMRHAAPEVMTDGRYSEKSVVFSLGYLLFEIHTYGVTPYNWLKDNETIRTHVLKGGRLPHQNCIPQTIIGIIKECQRQEPQDRPDLITLKEKLKDAYDMLTNTDADMPSAELPDLSDQDTEHTQLSSCIDLDNIERSKVLGIYGSQESEKGDSPVLQKIRGIPQIRELVEKTKEEDLKKLKFLDHKHIVKVLSMENYSGKDVALMTENSEQGNLLSWVLDKRCNPKDMVRLLVQAMSGLMHMHDSNIIHCDISAEHLMVFFDVRQRLMVKISRLGRSTYLKTSPMELEMYDDSIERNPPEVIEKPHTYSCSSDVWQFCIMCYVLYIALGKDVAGCKAEDVKPFGEIHGKQVLSYLKNDKRPPRPPCMPEWLHIAVKQGLLYKPQERPPLILLYDSFTYRKPFDSCLLTRWKEFHPDVIKQEQIDIEAMQPSLPSNDHVIPSEDHLSSEYLTQLSPVDVFMRHSYIYQCGNQETEPNNQNEDGYTYAYATSSIKMKDAEGLKDDVGLYGNRHPQPKDEKKCIDEEDLYEDIDPCFEHIYVPLYDYPNQEVDKQPLSGKYHDRPLPPLPPKSTKSPSTSPG